jgi:hypothetical protein
MLRTLASIALFVAFLANSIHAEDPFIDVTAKVAGLASNNSLSVAVSNVNFTDPAKEIAKFLRVEYTISGVKGVKTCEEGSTLRLSALAGKTLLVTKATYGDLPDRQDDVNAAGLDLSGNPPSTADNAANAAGNEVTAKLVSKISTNALAITVDNNTLGGDPAPGLSKQLVVTYVVGGKEHTVTTAENDELTLPAPDEGNGNLVIRKAIYGPIP